MCRVAIAILAVLLVGCSGVTEPHTAINDSHTESEDGGIAKNADRDKAESFFIALTNVQSAEEERQVLTEFGQWLTESGYKIRVDEDKGKHNLSCPYFPPVTPWTEHSFYNVQNLDLLPVL